MSFILGWYNVRVVYCYFVEVGVVYGNFVEDRH